MQFADLIENIE